MPHRIYLQSNNVPHRNTLKFKNYTLNDIHINRQHLMNPGKTDKKMCESEFSL